MKKKDLSKAIYQYFITNNSAYTFANGELDNLTLDGVWDCNDIADAAIQALQANDEMEGK